MISISALPWWRTWWPCRRSELQTRKWGLSWHLCRVIGSSPGWPGEPPHLSVVGHSRLCTAAAHGGGVWSKLTGLQEWLAVICRDGKLQTNVEQSPTNSTTFDLRTETDSRTVTCSWTVNKSWEWLTKKKKTRCHISHLEERVVYWWSTEWGPLLHVRATCVC